MTLELRDSAIVLFYVELVGKRHKPKWCITNPNNLKNKEHIRSFEAVIWALALPGTPSRATKGSSTGSTVE